MNMIKLAKKVEEPVEDVSLDCISGFFTRVEMI